MYANICLIKSNSTFSRPTFSAHVKENINSIYCHKKRIQICERFKSCVSVLMYCEDQLWAILPHMRLIAWVSTPQSSESQQSTLISTSTSCIFQSPVRKTVNKVHSLLGKVIPASLEWVQNQNLGLEFARQLFLASALNIWCWDIVSRSWVLDLAVFKLRKVSHNPISTCTHKFHQYVFLKSTTSFVLPVAPVGLKTKTLFWTSKVRCSSTGNLCTQHLGRCKI